MTPAERSYDRREFSGASVPDDAEERIKHVERSCGQWSRQCNATDSTMLKLCALGPLCYILSNSAYKSGTIQRSQQVFWISSQQSFFILEFLQRDPEWWNRCRSILLGLLRLLDSFWNCDLCRLLYVSGLELFSLCIEQWRYFKPNCSNRWVTNSADSGGGGRGKGNKFHFKHWVTVNVRMFSH